MIVHWHPDNRIYIRKNDWSIVFDGTKEEVEEILGRKLHDLPGEVRERQFFVGSHCADFDRRCSQMESKDAEHWKDGLEIFEKQALFSEKHKLNVEYLKDLAKPKKKPVKQGEQ